MRYIVHLAIFLFLISFTKLYAANTIAEEQMMMSKIGYFDANMPKANDPTVKTIKITNPITANLIPVIMPHLGGIVNG